MVKKRKKIYINDNIEKKKLRCSSVKDKIH